MRINLKVLTNANSRFKIIWIMALSLAGLAVTSGALAQTTPVGCAPERFQFGQETVLACTPAGLFKALNGNWKKIYPAALRTEVRKESDDSLYLFDPYDTHMLRRSVDGGQNWEVMGTPPFSNYEGRDHIFPSPVSGTIFLGDWDYPFSNRYARGVFKSTNGGITWTKVLSGGNGNYVSASPDFAVDGTAFAALDEYHYSLGIWKTVDWGETWFPVNQGLYTGGCISGHAWVVVSPQFSQDQTAFTSDCTGLYKTIDGAQSWSLIAGMALYDAPAFSPAYRYDQTLIVGNDNGLLLSQDGGLSYQQIWNGAAFAWGIRYQGGFESPVVTASLPVSAPYQIYVPVVYGTPALEFWVSAAIVEPSGFHCYLFRSRDYGVTWEEVPVFEATQWTYLPTLVR